jgi:3-polyprenyl-4-hydroxybenzoate decarboxylase
MPSEEVFAMDDSRRGSNIDADRFRLRHFLSKLDGGELEIRSDPIPFTDVAAIFLYANRKAGWFKSTGHEGAEIVGNVVGGRSRLARHVPDLGSHPR